MVIVSLAALLGHVLHGVERLRCPPVAEAVGALRACGCFPAASGWRRRFARRPEPEKTRETQKKKSASATLCFRAPVRGAPLHCKCQQRHSNRWLSCRRALRGTDTSSTIPPPLKPGLRSADRRVQGMGNHCTRGSAKHTCEQATSGEHNILAMKQRCRCESEW